MGSGQMRGRSQQKKIFEGGMPHSWGVFFRKSIFRGVNFQKGGPFDFFDLQTFRGGGGFPSFPHGYGPEPLTFVDRNIKLKPIYLHICGALCFFVA